MRHEHEDFAPTPELPVPDVSKAQAYYQDMLGFDIVWHNAAGKIGAVAFGDCAIFFREVEGDITPATLWVFCEDLNDAHTGLVQRGADIVEGPENKPRGLRQFTVYDHCKNRYYFFRDL